MRFSGVVVAVLTLASSVFGQAPAKTKPLPFYFPVGIQQTADPILQRQEYIRYLVSSQACNQGNPNGFQAMIAEPGSISIQTDILSTDSVTENPAHLRIVLDHFIKMPDGRIRVTTLCDQFYITQEQVNVVVDDLKNVVKVAAQDDANYYSKIYTLAIEARAAKLGLTKETLTAQLDEPMPDNKKVTFREFNRLPVPMDKASDFVPRELHLGYNIPLDGILGVTWLNTGVIYYNPQARVTDYLTGRPKVMSHEMVHGNKNVEKFPMSAAFDVELMASLPEALYAENMTDLVSHSYMGDIRELDEIYFGFDFKEMSAEVFKMDFAGNYVIDEKAYRYYYDQLQTVKKENLDFFQNVSIPEFYSDPIWWGAVNDLRNDGNSVFRMTMALHYNPTLLGGSKATKEWLDAHEEDIKTIASKAFEKGLDRSVEPDSGDMTISPAMVAEYNRMFTQDEQDKIQVYFKQHPEKLQQIRTMSPTELLSFMSQFKTSKGVTIQ